MILRLLLAFALLLAAGPASADFQAAVGHFGIGTGAVSTTVSVTGLSFQPKTIILFWNGRTNSTDAVGGADIRPGMGFATSTTDRRCATAFADDGVATTDTTRASYNDAVVVILTAVDAVDGKADFDAWLSDGFRLIIDDQFTQDYRIAYIALGGSDITNVATGGFQTDTITGDLDITTVGFQPDTALFIYTNAVTENTPGTANSMSLGIGAAAGSTPSNATCSIVSQDGQTDGANAGSYCRAGQSYGLESTTGNNTDVVGRASVTSWLSNGFRWNRIEATTSSRWVYFLAIKGGQYVVGDLLTQTDTTTDIVESGFGFQPQVFLTVSHGFAQNADDTTNNTGAKLSIGAGTSPSNRLAVAVWDEDGPLTSEAASASEFDEIYANISTADAIDGLMDYKSQDSGGGTFIMDDADPTQMFVWYWAAGQAAGGGGTGCRGGLLRVGVGC